MMREENVGIRLEFDDRHPQGLRRCWFLLKPDITNFGDLASQIRECFGLRHSIDLCMDDFILPSFLSTCIIKHKDIIMVKKVEAKQKDICKPCDGQNLLEDFENARVHDMENVCHLDPPGDDDSTKKKRKHSKNPLELKSQNVENNHENEFKPDNNSNSNMSEPQPLAVDTTKACHVIKFEILLPLRRLPIKGDILAYRYIVSSSLVHPQLSSPQVGEVSSFDSKTFQVIMLPVTDYIFSLDDNLRATTGQPNANSLYKEDGSLEIDYLSLVDVRLVKVHDWEEEQKISQDEEAGKDKWEEALLKGNLNEPNASTAGQSNSWRQWIPNQSTTTMSWSFQQPIAPFAGRGNGRTIWASNRSMNNRIPTMNKKNWNPRW